MFDTQRSSLSRWLFECAGAVGLVAALITCSLVYAGTTATEFWLAAAVSLAGNAIFIVHLVAQRIAKMNELTWRELVLANIVPFAAFAVTAVLAGEVANLFHLPFLAGAGFA